MAIVDISGFNDTDVVNGAIITNNPTAISTGTGVFDAFLSMQASPEEEAFNTDAGTVLDGNHDEFTHSVLLSTVPTVTINGVEYLEFRSDLNEANSGTNDLILLQQLKIFQEGAPDLVESDWNGAGFYDGDVPEYTLGEGTQVLLSDAWNAGSGKGDYIFLIPKSNFDFTSPDQYLYVYMKMGTTSNSDPRQSDATFEEFGVLKVAEAPPSIHLEKVAIPLTIGEGTSAEVTYTYTVTNTSPAGAADPLALTSFVDDSGTPGDPSDDVDLLEGFVQGSDYGDHYVSGDDGDFFLESNEAWVFTDTRTVDAGAIGSTIHNVAVVQAHDNENVSVQDDDDATVTVVNAPPTIQILKTGPATIGEGGADVTWTFTITNLSGPTDPVTVTALTDTVFGNLLDDAVAANGGNPIVLAPGGSFSFGFNPPGDLVLDAGQTHVNVVTVTGRDDEGSTDTDTDDHTITATDRLPLITIDKTGPATVPEGGADVTWTFTITAAASNASTDPVTVTSLNDTVFGDLLDEAVAANGGNPIVLAPGASFSFSFNPPGDVVLDAGQTHVNVVTVHGEDDEHNDTSDSDGHTITGTDRLPLITIEKTGPSEIQEGGEDVNFHFVITAAASNASTDPVTVTSLNDTVFGDLLDVAEGQNGGNAIVLAPGESFEFDYNPPGEIVLNAGETHVNVITVHGEDDEHNDTSDDDDHTITATDVLPAIQIVKTGPDTIFEGGEDVTWNFEITNIGTVETVTVTSLDDTVFGDLLDEAVAANGGNPIVLAPGASFSFGFNPDGNLVLNAGEQHTNVVTVHGEDDEHNDVSDDDDHVITALDVLPRIHLEKTANPTSIFEGTASDVTYTYVVTNTSPAGSVDPLLLTSFVDDNGTPANNADNVNLLTGFVAGASYGAFYASGDADGDYRVDSNEAWTFNYTHENIVANAGSIINTAVVTAQDDEANSVSDQDDAVATVRDVLPAIDIQKTVDADGNGVFNDFETVQAFGDQVTYKYVLTNTSPVAAVDPLTIDDLVDDKIGDLVINGVTQAGVTLVKSGDADNLLEAGETWTYFKTVTVNLAPGETVHNIATVTGADDEGSPVTDSDTADIIQAVVGPGVRTPGFWSNLGKQFWDGIEGNETKVGPNFPVGELLKPLGVDSDNNDATAKVVGLLIGDYNNNGETDAGEDTFFISLPEALKIIDASQKDLQDGRFVLARDEVATWLNFLAGNPIGDASDPLSPKTFLNEGIDWLQATSTGGSATDVHDSWSEGGAKVPQSSALWQVAIDGNTASASLIHQELDTYNNTGSTFSINPDGTKSFHMYASDGG